MQDLGSTERLDINRWRPCFQLLFSVTVFQSFACVRLSPHSALPWVDVRFRKGSDLSSRDPPDQAAPPNTADPDQTVRRRRLAAATPNGPERGHMGEKAVKRSRGRALDFTIVNMMSQFGDGQQRWSRFTLDLLQALGRAVESIWVSNVSIHVGVLK